MVRPPKSAYASGRTPRTSRTRSTATPTSGDVATTTRASQLHVFTLLIADVVGGTLEVVLRGVMAAGGIMDGARGGGDLPRTTSTA
jgi:hypothetical protein